MNLLTVAVIGLLAIVAASLLSERLGIASPLVLILGGMAVSMVPWIPNTDIDPNWILAGILPPLLYSASVSMPTIDFRREFRAIGFLSVFLVVISTIVLGFFFIWLIPDLPLPWAFALGAIVSPTDAVAVTIVKRSGISQRLITVLEGESLLNDATSLVLLRTAIVGAMASVSLWSVTVSFFYSLLGAVGIGFLAGRLNLFARQHLQDPTLTTVISFAVPFLASLPANYVGASGLVAAVTAGLVTGRRSARVLSPRQRLSDSQNWHAIELILEGAIFLLMGLELSKVLIEMEAAGQNVLTAVGIALAVIALSFLIRAAFVAPLLAGLHFHTKRRLRLQPRIASFERNISGWLATELHACNATKTHSRRTDRLRRVSTRLRRILADIDYFASEPLGPREGAILVWAGMRGAVTVAAAQTLPLHAPMRSLMLFIAFAVASTSMFLQGGLLPAVLAVIKPAVKDPSAAQAERRRLAYLLRRVEANTKEREAATSTIHPGQNHESSPSKTSLPDSHSVVSAPTPDRVVTGPARTRRPDYELTLKIIADKRRVILDARDDGIFSSACLNRALVNLDADEIAIRLKLGSESF